MKKELSYKGIQIGYSVSGEGQSVVLIHGFGEDASIWDGLAAQLEKNHRLIIPDLPGTGSSGQLLQDKANLEEFAAVIKAVLDAEHIFSTILIGHSMGGYITLAFAEQYPEMLNAFGLFHSSAYSDDSEKVATRRKAIESIEKNGSIPFLKTSIPALFYDAEKSKAELADLLEKGNKFPAKVLIQYYEAMINRPDRTHVLKDAKVPVLLILGEHDKAVPFKLGLEQARMAPQTHLHILRESAHLGMLEEKEKSGRILGDFLQAVGGN